MNIETAITITGRVISKKNSKQWIVRGGRRFLVPSAAYERFKNDAIGQIRKQVAGKRPGPQVVHCEFYMQGKIHVDGDNMLTSIFDILQDSGVIGNDDQIMAGSFVKHPGCGGWSTKILINDY